MLRTEKSVPTTAKVLILQFCQLVTYFANGLGYNHGDIKCKLFKRSSFCQSENETPIHFFHGCIKTNLLWYKLKKFVKTKIDLPVNTPQSAIFGFLNYEK